MYNTTSTEFHPFGTNLSYHEFDDIVIQDPLPIQSYSWSDFPTIYQEESELLAHATKPTCSTGNVIDEDSMFFLSQYPSSPLYEANHKGYKTPLIEANSKTTNTSRKVISETSSKKKVRFAPFPDVRVYSLVLGDHPNCEDGLAIELGWEYRDFQTHSDHDIISKISKVTQDTMHPGKRHRRSCPRRSYLTRKKLLLDVAGCTEDDLNQRTLEAKTTSTERARSEREDYYYHLAFAKSLRKISLNSSATIFHCYWYGMLLLMPL